MGAATGADASSRDRRLALAAGGLLALALASLGMLLIVTRSDRLRPGG